MRVGYDGGTSTFNMVGGNLNITDWLQVGHGDSIPNSVGTVNVTGGTITETGATGGYVSVGWGGGGLGVWNQDGGHSNLKGVCIGYAGAYGTVNLNDGVFATGFVQSGWSSNGNAAVNFNGGTLKVNASSTAIRDDILKAFDPNPFFYVNGAVFNAYVLDGGAVVDTSGYNISFADVPLRQGPGGSTGGLSVSGGGQLTLNRHNTYIGLTDVGANTILTVKPFGTLATKSINVAAGRNARYRRPRPLRPDRPGTHQRLGHLDLGGHLDSHAQRGPDRHESDCRRPRHAWLDQSPVHGFGIRPPDGFWHIG